MTPTPAADEPEYLKVEEVAARLKLKDKTIRDWILRGELPAYKLGKEWRIRRDDFDQAMQARRTTAAGVCRRSLGSRRPRIGSNSSLQPLKLVCILHHSLEDSDHARLLICHDDLFAAGDAVASARMSLEHRDIGTIPRRDIRAVAEALADVLLERGIVAAGSPARVLDAARVADLLGRDRQWVYAHAGELGAFRYGDGPKARIGFDLVTVEQWKRERQIRSESPPRRRDRRRSSAAGVGATRLIPYDVPGSGP